MTSEILKQAINQGVILYIRPDKNLGIKSKGEIDGSFLGQIRRHKKALIDFLTDYPVYSVEATLKVKPYCTRKDLDMSLENWDWVRRQAWWAGYRIGVDDISHGEHSSPERAPSIWIVRTRHRGAIFISQIEIMKSLIRKTEGEVNENTK